MKPVVKRKGMEQSFDERKVYATCYSACLNVPIDHIKAEKICEKVCKDLRKWLKDKKVVTSTQLHNATNKILKKYSKEAAYMYHTHRDIN